MRFFTKDKLLACSFNSSPLSRLRTDSIGILITGVVLYSINYYYFMIFRLYIDIEI